MDMLLLKPEQIVPNKMNSIQSDELFILAGY